ncbi:hypothetical protein ACQEVI_03520 [Promicromonospora sp. CA-289599]|uniref:hypothetical protein n=1 Tax=Promicromonospora sp. CA-289599 TaxID=3240014 RepID=UPI003D8D78D6
MERLQVHEVPGRFMMSADSQFRTSEGSASDEEAPRHRRCEHPTEHALVGATMIERAKTVIVVARRVDDDHAAQMLSDAAVEAGVPVPVVADQVMTVLQSAAETITQSTLTRALGVVSPVDRQEGDT